MRCRHIADVWGKHKTAFEAGNRIYDTDALCPTVLTRYDDNTTGFKIMEEKVKLVGGGWRNEI